MRMVASKTFVWICLALCVALGGSEVFYGKTGGEMLMDCGTADQNKEVEWKFDNGLLIKTRKYGMEVRGSANAVKNARLQGSKLKISSLEIFHSGDYSCNGKDIGNKGVKVEHTLHVMSVSVSPSQTVMHSTDVTLTCEVHKDSPAQIQWLKPDKTPYGNSNSMNVITLKSINPTDAGSWTCQVKEKDEMKVEKTVDISVLGPLTSAEEVIAPAKGSANLTCSIPISTHISTGGWSRDPPNGLKFPTLQRDSKGLKWSTENTSPKVMFSKEPLSTDFTVTLKNPNEDGRYVCTVIFQDGRNLSTALTLKIDKKKNDFGKKVGGVEMWVWVTTAAALVLVIGLVISIVLILRRNNQMKRKVRKLKSMRQPLTDRIYCQCNRTEAQYHPGKRGRPPPLPSNQYDVME